MQCLKGIPVSPGYARGTAMILDRDAAFDVPRFRIRQEHVDDEVGRFHAALERSSRELHQLENRIRSELGELYSSIFSAHLALLNDKQFKENVHRRIRDELVNVEHALSDEIADLERLLASVENEYLHERAQDVRDIGKRVMRQLIRTDAGRLSRLSPQSVVVARELLPSETIDLDRRHVAAIVTEQGGENSHAAILARALGIPAVTGVVGAVSQIDSGSQLLVDGQAGLVTIMPTDSAAGDFAILKQHYDEAASAAELAERLDCITLDGTRVSLLANINRVEEVSLVARHHLDGVGLFRTEFMYMDSVEAPTIERQAEVYRQMLVALGEAPLVIRTLDLGGDKVPAFLVTQREANPNLGLRGLRFSLDHPELLRTQLRAIMAAAAGRRLRLMFPMVLGEGDLRAAIEQIHEVAKEIGVDSVPPIGAMIETPSALFALPQILQQVDFVSIGTNDLTQFLLAADRNAVELASDYSVLHPSVLRAIRHVVQACFEAGRDLCVCGEAAGDAETAGMLVGLGVRQLSMSPVRAAAVRLKLRTATYTELKSLAEEALALEGAASVRQLLRRWSNGSSVS